MSQNETLLLCRRDVAKLLSLEKCIEAVEAAFLSHARGQTLPPGVLGVHAKDGGFHIKAAGLMLGRAYFAAKINGNFFFNRQRFGMPNIQGVIVLCDAENGQPLALMDSIEITILRTGAATAVAAKYLARLNSHVATICGCGNQGRVQLRALAQVLPLRRVWAFDTDEQQARSFAAELCAELRIEIQSAHDLGEAVRASDVCVTCTPANEAFLMREWLRPGTFVAAAGADNPEKQELAPAVFAGNKIVADSLEQCATIGDLHHAVNAGAVTRADVHAELSDVVAGIKPGRTSQQEITIFNSTGVALEDVAAAAVAYEEALRTGTGMRMDLAA